MTTDALIDSVWNELRPSLFRRSILGKRRCSEIVLHALAEFPDREFAARKATQGSSAERRIVEETEKRVAKRMKTSTGDEVYGSVILSLVLMWAVSSIVQYLVLQWWKRHFDAAAFRREYGWT